MKEFRYEGWKIIWNFPKSRTRLRDDNLEKIRVKRINSEGPISNWYPFQKSAEKNPGVKVLKHNAVTIWPSNSTLSSKPQRIEDMSTQ